ncbi:hypothetical protein Golomagni_06013, partial [Golovinomyces magnicellulatus]
WVIKGDLIYRVQDWHDAYGPVVRVAPNELSFKNPEAWKDIYGRKTSEGRYEIPTHKPYYDPLDQPNSLLVAPREHHDWLRKIISPGFSDRTIRAQEENLGQYVDLLMEQLSAQCTSADNNRVNMADWMTFCTFDIIGSLTFGSDFDCLRTGKYHPWVHTIISTLRELTFLRALEAMGMSAVVKFLIFTVGIGAKQFKEQEAITMSKMNARLKMGTEKNDFMDELIKAKVDPSELHRHVGLFVIAGSETSATLLTGAVYLLATNPEAYKKWQDEVRNTFEKESDITLLTVNKLDYMLAVLKEALRLYPPVAGAPARMVPKGGATIAGHFINEGTEVGIYQWAVNHDEEFFFDAHKFDPDRCLHRASVIKESEDGVLDEDFDKSNIVKKYANDRMDVLNPFLIGPRNCIGQNLAYAEMRLILARLAFRFDFELCEESKDWLRGQKNFLLWEKPDMFVRLKERA